jgi:sigma-B regulation protein RsbU (phosphoserine phosphatase)
MSLQNWFRKQAIQRKIFIPFFAISLITSSLFTYYGYMQSSKAIIDGIDKRLLIAALTMRQLLPNDYFDRIEGPDSVAEADHWRYTAKIERFLKYVDATYLYALYKDKGKYYFVASADMETPYYTEYEHPAPNIYEVQKSGRVHISTTSDPDWGLLRSVVTRFPDSNGRQFIIGADIHASEVAALKKRSLVNLLLMGAFSFLVAVVFSYLASYAITRPLSKLSAFTRRLIAGDFSSTIRLDPDLFPDAEQTRAETALLAFDFNQMQDQLVQHIEQLKLTQSARERAESELRIAGQIQETFLPPPFPEGSFDGRVQIAASMKTAKQAGGDLYHYFPLDDEHLFLAIGDVSGKGMPAAMFMSVVVVLLRSAAKLTRDLAEIMSRINEDLAEGNESCTFVTLFIGILNTRTGELCFANGGHNPPRLITESGAVRTVPVKTNFVVGAMPDMPFTAESMTLQPGETLFMYTDGVTEAINEAEEFYGEERLDDLLDSASAEATPDSITQLVSDDVITFTGQHEQADDITVMTLAYTNPVPDRVAQKA